MEPTPPIAGLTWLVASPDAVGVEDIKGPIHFTQVNWDFSFVGRNGGIKVVPPLKGLLSEGVSLENAYIKGGENVLDGIHWNNVVFIGAHIVYRGGQVELRNVRFVGCTFDFPFSQNGSEMTAYVSLSQDNLTIRG